MNVCINRLSLAGVISIFFAFWAAVPAQAGSGFYVSSELGINFGSSMDMTGSSNDRASVCDEYINPKYDMVEGATGYEGYNCTGPNRGSTGDWYNDFSSDEGILLGTALGYRMRDSRFRIELEYFYRDTGYDETSDVPSASGESGDKLEQELVTATDRIGSLTSHNLFANLYIDFANDSRFTPYIGFGVGFGFTDVEYGSLWARNSDATNITTGEGLENDPDFNQADVDAIRANLAGTASVEDIELDDTLFGYQILFGVDYALTESVLLGVKGRWVDFDSFKDGGLVWDPLRGHPPNLRKDGSEPVEGALKLDDIEMFAISMNLKYQF